LKAESQSTELSRQLWPYCRKSRRRSLP